MTLTITIEGKGVIANSAGATVTIIGSGSGDEVWSRSEASSLTTINSRNSNL